MLLSPYGILLDHADTTVRQYQPIKKHFCGWIYQSKLRLLDELEKQILDKCVALINNVLGKPWKLPDHTVKTDSHVAAT